jgi:hypothetical protein
VFYIDPGAWINFNATNLQTLQNNKNSAALASKVSDLFKTNKDLLAECQAISAAISEFEKYIKFGKDLPCPYCAQLISKHALVCNYCQGSLTIGNAEYIRVAITAKPYLVARDAETIKMLMAEVSRIDLEQQELQRIIAEIEEETRKQEELEQIEYHQNLAKAAEAERLEIEKKRKNEQKTAKDKLASDFQLLGKVIGLTPDKFRKAESLLSKGQIEELIAFVVHEEISFNELILSVQSKIQSNTEIVSFKAGKGTYFEVTRMIRKEWLWWRNVVNILRDYESIGNLTKVKHELTDIYRKDSADVESPDYLTTELISKFLTLQALVLYKLGEKKQAKKCMKSSDKQNWDSLYLKYKKECRSAKAASLIFYQDLCTAMYL